VLYNVVQRAGFAVNHASVRLMLPTSVRQLEFDEISFTQRVKPSLFGITVKPLGTFQRDCT
jgi:hypothetical protein